MHCKYIILKGYGFIYPPMLIHTFFIKIFFEYVMPSSWISTRITMKCS